MFDDQSLKECVASDSERHHAELTRLARYNLQDEFRNTLLTHYQLCAVCVSVNVFSFLVVCVVAGLYGVAGCCCAPSCLVFFFTPLGECA